MAGARVLALLGLLTVLVPGVAAEGSSDVQINCTAAGPSRSAEQEAEFLRGVRGEGKHEMLPEWLPYNALLLLLALMMGLGKGGLPGVSTTSVAFNALYAPDGCLDLATSMQVPVTTLADIAVIFNFIQDARWDVIRRLMPSTVVGVAIGAQLVGSLSAKEAKLLVGSILCIILALGIYQELFPAKKSKDDKDKDAKKPAAWADSIWFAFIVGLVGGFATILTNSMGPMLNVYFLTLKLEPKAFVGTRATFFSVVNFFKVGQRLYSGTLSPAMLWIGCQSGLLSVVGVFAAKVVITRISGPLFTKLQYVALTYSCFKLLHSALG